MRLASDGWLVPGAAIGEAARLDIEHAGKRGDRILDRPLSQVGGKGLFVKELEVALLEDRADIAVHSMKDVPMVIDEAFRLMTFGAREMPLAFHFFDCLMADGRPLIDEPYRVRWDALAAVTGNDGNCRGGASSRRDWRTPWNGRDRDRRGA